VVYRKQSTQNNDSPEPPGDLQLFPSYLWVWWKTPKVNLNLIKGSQYQQYNGNWNNCCLRRIYTWTDAFVFLFNTLPLFNSVVSVFLFRLKTFYLLGVIHLWYVFKLATTQDKGSVRKMLPLQNDSAKAGPGMVVLQRNHIADFQISDFYYLNY